MATRMIGLGAVALVVGLFVSAARAADVKSDEVTHQGTVVSASTGKLVMTDVNGKEHSHDVGQDVKVTLNSKDAKLADLHKGDRVTVTMKNNKVFAIAATNTVEPKK